MLLYSKINSVSKKCFMSFLPKHYFPVMPCISCKHKTLETKVKTPWLSVASILSKIAEQFYNNFPEHKSCLVNLYVSTKKPFYYKTCIICNLSHPKTNKEVVCSKQEHLTNIWILLCHSFVGLLDRFSSRSSLAVVLYLAKECICTGKWPAMSPTNQFFFKHMTKFVLKDLTSAS